jgi:hypothetical protein
MPTKKTLRLPSRKALTTRALNPCLLSFCQRHEEWGLQPRKTMSLLNCTLAKELGDLAHNELRECIRADM